MYEQNTKLKAQVASLKEKQKALLEELERKKKEVVVFKKRAQQQSANVQGPGKSHSDRPATAPDVHILAAPTYDVGSRDVLPGGNNGRKSDDNLLHIAQKLKER